MDRNEQHMVRSVQSARPCGLRQEAGAERREILRSRSRRTTGIRGECGLRSNSGYSSRDGSRSKGIGGRWAIARARKDGKQTQKRTQENQRLQEQGRQREQGHRLEMGDSKSTYHKNYDSNSDND